MNDEYGVGALDILNAIAGRYSLFIGTNNADNFSSEYNFFLRMGSKLKIAACWMAKATGKVSETCHTDYDITLRDINGKTVARSNFVRNNVEYFEYTATLDGDYHLTFLQAGSHVQEDNFAIAYRIISKQS